LANGRKLILKRIRGTKRPSGRCETHANDAYIKPSQLFEPASERTQSENLTTFGTFVKDNCFQTNCSRTLNKLSKRNIYCSGQTYTTGTSP